MRNIALVSIVLVLLAGCAPAVGTKAPPGTLTYTGPVELQLNKGETLPGTRIQYVGNTADGAQVSIDGQMNLKRVGDSLFWKGEMVPGAAADFSTRLVMISDEKLSAAGTVQIAVADARPEAAPLDTTAPARYKVPVAYKVNRGEMIPGTTVVFEGMDGQRAKLSNLEGGPDRAIGEMIHWTGRLRDKVWNDLNVRVVLATANALDVAGTAEVSMAP